jgi:site-specific DNA-methyltransferase (adenine-specific)
MTLPMSIAMRTNASTEWATPVAVFVPLMAEFDFQLDVCASADNAKCDNYYTAVDDGLRLPWAPRRCWMNPPYGLETPKWVKKARIEAERGALVVGLVPARTDTAWFHNDVVEAGAEIRFIRGRVRFVGPRIRDRAPFPSLIVVWRPR